MAQVWLCPFLCVHNYLYVLISKRISASPRFQVLCCISTYNILACICVLLQCSWVSTMLFYCLRSNTRDQSSRQYKIGFTNVTSQVSCSPSGWSWGIGNCVSASRRSHKMSFLKNTVFQCSHEMVLASFGLFFHMSMGKWYFHTSF